MAATEPDVTQRVFAAVVQGMRTMADGTIRVTLELSPGQDRAAALAIASDVGATVAVARLHDHAAMEATRPKDSVDSALGRYGEQAKLLKLSGFFRTPAVWKACGTDDEFLAWIRQQPCSVTGARPAEAAHVRRVADGAGTAIKPEYSAIPLCREMHQRQHQEGESVLGGPEAVDRKRIRHVEQWAWDACKAQLGYESMADVPPGELRSWAAKRGLMHCLPNGYC